MTYPKMIYRGGVLSSKPANQRAVYSEEEELAAASDEFGEWDGKSKDVPSAPGPTNSVEAQQAAFEAAASPRVVDDAEDEVPTKPRAPGVARGKAK